MHNHTMKDPYQIIKVPYQIIKVEYITKKIRFTNWPTKKKEIDWTTTPDFPYRKLRNLLNTLSFFFLRICKPLNDQLFCNLFNRFAGKPGKPYQWLASVHFTWEKKDILFNMPKTTYQITILLFFWIIKWYTWKS